MEGAYILEGKVPVPVRDLEEWLVWLDGNDREIRQAEVGEYVVITMFLAYDYNPLGVGVPELFETVVFDGAGGREWVERAATWEMALEAHRRGVAVAVGQQR